MLTNTAATVTTMAAATVPKTAATAAVATITKTAAATKAIFVQYFAQTC